MWFTLVVGWLVVGQPTTLETRVCHYVETQGVKDKNEVAQAAALESLDTIHKHAEQGAPVVYYRVDFDRCAWAAWM